MTACHQQASGTIELYFYDELRPVERGQVVEHLRSCAECRNALEELTLIRDVLSARPAVDAPPRGDWSPFMRKLDGAIAFERHGGDLSSIDKPAAAVPAQVASLQRINVVAYVAMAALVTLVTSGVAYVTRSSSRTVSKPTTAGLTTPPPVASTGERSLEAAFTALSEQHFERSKLVVLGLANKDPQHVEDADWAYERGLASDLLSDTRVYRQAAEERGMKTIAGVMSDLELVLLQTSLADVPDADALEQIQRLIHKRDLVTKMDAATAATTGS